MGSWWMTPTGTQPTPEKRIQLRSTQSSDIFRVNPNQKERSFNIWTNPNFTNNEETVPKFYLQQALILKNGSHLTFDGDFASIQVKQPAASSEKKTLKPSVKVKGDFFPDNLQVSPIFVGRFTGWFPFFPICTSFCWISLYEKVNRIWWHVYCKIDDVCWMLCYWFFLCFPFLIRCFTKPTSPLKSAAGTSSFFWPTKTRMF